MTLISVTASLIALLGSLAGSEEDKIVKFWGQL